MGRPNTNLFNNPFPRLIFIKNQKPDFPYKMFPKFRNNLWKIISSKNL